MVLIIVYDTVFLCWIRLLSWTCCLIWTPHFPRKKKGLLELVWLQLSLNSLLTGESWCPVSSEHGWHLYMSTCARLWACLYNILSLLLFGLSFWRSILILAPMLLPPLSKYKHSCSWAGSYIRDLIQAKSNLVWGGEKSIFNLNPIHHAATPSLVPGQRRGCCVWWGYVK